MTFYRIFLIFSSEGFITIPVIKSTKLLLSTLILINLGSFLFSEEFNENEFKNYLKEIHSNIYSTFGYSDDNEIYNCLAYTFEGEELDKQFYEFLKNIRDLEKQGYSNHIKSIEYEKLNIEKRSKKKIRIFMKWKVEALVKHVLHEHDRIGIYEAIYTLKPIASSEWKIIKSQIINSERIISPQRYYNQ